MKVLLNLLPQEKRNALEQRLRVRFFAWLVFLIFTLEVFYALVLVGVIMLLNIEKKNQELTLGRLEQYRSEERRLLEIEGEFREANLLADRYLLVGKSHVSFSRVLTLLERNGQDSIALDRLVSKDFNFTLTGVAETREELIAYYERLKGEECFESAVMPRSNLFSQENVIFQIDLTLRSQCFKSEIL